MKTGSGKEANKGGKLRENKVSQFVVLFVGIAFFVALAAIIFYSHPADFHPMRIVFMVLVVLFAVFNFVAFRRVTSKHVAALKKETQKLTHGLNVLQSVLNGLEVSVYVSEIGTDKLLFVNEKMKAMYGLEGDVTGLHCHDAFYKTADFEGHTSRCKHCPVPRLIKKPDAPINWIQHSAKLNRYFRNTDRIIDWIDGSKVHLQLSADVTELMQIEEELKRNLELQEIIADISRSFVSNDPIHAVIERTLHTVGDFLQLHRIVVLALNEAEERFNYSYGWADSLVKADVMMTLPYNPESRAHKVFDGKITNIDICGDVSEDPDAANVMAPYNAKAFIMMPVIISKKLWGVIVVKDCVKTRVWNEADVQLMQLVSGIMSELISRHEMEDNLMRMSSIVEKSPQLIAYINSDGTPMYVNEGAEQLSGYTRNELLNGSLLNRFFLEHGANVGEKGRQAKSLNDLAAAFEVSVIRKDGEERHLYVTSFVADTKLHSTGIVAVDVTAQKAMQRELEDAKEEAVRASNAKSQFFSRMSHEMRTPMNAIIGMTNIAKDTNDAAKKEDCLNRIDGASKHLLGVINDILDMAKIEANKFELYSYEFNFEKMLASVLNITRFRADEKKQSLSVYVDEKLTYSLIGDEIRLSQVLTNLLSNAVKFTHDGGTIELNADVVSETEATVVLQISINDNGIGLTPEQQSRLFVSFEQADGSISRQYGGTGLGLAISKQIVELMDGKIWVESEYKKGARFIFTAKMRKGPPIPKGLLNKNLIEPRKIRKDAEKNLFAGHSMLLVEDMDVNREIVVSLLEKTGVVIDQAENGRAAVSMFTQSPSKYSLILMDLHMPVLDGLDATREIRKLDIVEAKHIPIVAMTASVFREDIERCINAGMNEHIGKPINFDELVRTLKKYIKQGANVNTTKNKGEDEIMDDSAGKTYTDTTYINVADGLRRLKNNGALYRKLLVSFEGEKIAEELTRAIAEKDSANTARIAHALKGSALNLSLVKIAETASQIEQRATGGAPCDELAEQLTADMHETLEAIHAVIETKTI